MTKSKPTRRYCSSCRSRLNVDNLHHIIYHKPFRELYICSTCYLNISNSWHFVVIPSKTFSDLPILTGASPLGDIKEYFKKI
ncbi:MAG: hypothetical protein RBR07_04765 [Arcobacteraceae bacterium]|nr:hypothetical protein [Arcobacteraceae bacterium]